MSSPTQRDPAVERALQKGLKAVRSLQAQLRAERIEKKAAEDELSQLRKTVAKTRDVRSTSPTFDGGLGGRPAIEAYRNTNIAGFMGSVNDLGAIGDIHGSGPTRFAARTGVRADLACLYAAAPASEAEAERRDVLRVLFSNPASAEVLAGTEEWHERAREDLISLALRSGVEVSTWELVRRSAEQAQTSTTNPPSRAER
ncbi:MAG: hypothetical protein L3K00_03105 [Thermoplasmata archaeon]|nr:hypothetical protein [Thermoplasmata archaeon]